MCGELQSLPAPAVRLSPTGPDDATSTGLTSRPKCRNVEYQAHLPPSAEWLPFSNIESLAMASLRISTNRRPAVQQGFPVGRCHLRWLRVGSYSTFEAVIWRHCCLLRRPVNGAAFVFTRSAPLGTLQKARRRWGSPCSRGSRGQVLPNGPRILRPLSAALLAVERRSREYAISGPRDRAASERPSTPQWYLSSEKSHPLVAVGSRRSWESTWVRAHPLEQQPLSTPTHSIHNCTMEPGRCLDDPPRLFGCV
jgi:hypothetical protein